MNRPTMRRPSAVMLVAVFAIVLSMGGGTALAARHYLITSTSQISPKVLHKLRGNTGPRGKTGPQGLKGDTGATGPAGVVMIQRTTGSATPGDNAGDTGSTTLSNAGFTNPAANTDNLFFASATFTPPAACTVGPDDSPFFSFGGEVDSNTPIFGGGGPFTPGDPPSSVQGGIASTTALGAGAHTLTMNFNTNCTGSGQHGSITNIELDTAAVG